METKSETKLKPNDGNEKRWLDSFRKSSVFQFLTYSWATSLCFEAYRREISAEDLWNLRDHEQADTCFKRLDVAYQRELEISDPSKRSLLRALRRSHLRDFPLVFVCKIGWLVASLITNAFVLRLLLNTLEDANSGREETITIGAGLEAPVWGFLYAALFGILEVIRSTCVNAHWALATLIGLRSRIAVNALVFGKLTRLRDVDSVGEVVNLLTNDGQRVMEACQYGLFCFTGPITLISICIVGLWVLGPAILLGFVVLLLAVPLQSWIGRRIGALRREAVSITDERVSLVNEILSAVKLIKLYAWESSFSNKVARVRFREMVKLRSASYVKVVNLALASGLPVVVTLVTFAFHTLVLGETLGASQAFATIALFNVARFPLSVIPLAVRAVSEALVAMKRLDAFLAQPEITPEQGPTQHEGGPKGNDDQLRIRIQDGLFAWENATSERNKQQNLSALQSNSPESDGVDVKQVSTDSEEHPLQISSLEVKHGELIAIVGVVASGKTSLLSGALGGAMKRVGGTVDIWGSVAYCAQHAWCFNGTIRENILLDKDYDPKRFQKVIEACGLIPDLEVLGAGDQTEIGERGINLSGGQKARIALARAVYADADVYLLDDVLSAVDAHVGKHIHEKVIKGLLRGKTILLATHSKQFLQEFDRIVVLEDGKIVADHAPSNDMLEKLQLGDEEDEEKEALNNTPNLEQQRLSVSQRDEESRHSTRVAESAATKLREDKMKEKGSLIVTESKDAGAVSFSTLKTYFQEAGGWFAASLLFVLFVGAELSKLVSDAWVSVWVDDGLELINGTLSNETRTVESIANDFGGGDEFYVLVYLGACIILMLVQIARGMYFAQFSLRASSGLHDGVFRILMSAKMEFFDTTPTGRILNRFAGDIDHVDVKLVDVAETCVSLLVRVTMALGLVAVLFPYFLVAMIPVVIMYAYLTNFFRKVVRQMKRLESISKSPLVSHTQSVVQGLTTIRMYSKLDRYFERNLLMIDATSRSSIGYHFANRWLGYRLDYATTFIATVTALLCVLFSSTVSSGLAGLALTSALQTSGILQFATRMLAETEGMMTSVERLRSFQNTTPLEHQVLEDGDDKGSSTSEKVPDSWPENGLVEFKNYSTTYQEHLPLVLNKLNLTLPAGKMTGIVGRTGSGKSSTLLALFRILEATEGSISVDGRELAKVPLEIIRSRVSIIPQDPTLFKGTIRSNMDPFGQFTDSDIWESLERVKLKSYVSELPHGLSHEITEGGSNLSSGQRQLLCFSRALLRKSKIICLDEATSSIDSEMDSMIQETIKEAFFGHTLIIIAHRIATVVHCQHIVVLEAGTAAEAGSPAELLQNPNGQLRKLVDAMGPEEARRLEAVANHSS